MRRTRCARLLEALAFAAIIGGCASHPVEHFYTVSDLNLQAGADATPARANGRTVVVAEASLPELINRPQMVMRASGHEISILENHRWAEPLASDLTRALIAALRQADAGADFVSSEGPRAQDGAQVLEVEIGELVSGPGPEVSLQASWVLRDRSRASVGQGQLTTKIPCAAGPEAVVAAYAQAMRALADAIAASLH